MTASQVTMFKLRLTMQQLPAMPIPEAPIMSQVTSAVFDGGVFRPDSPVGLPPETRVSLVVEPLDESNDAAAILAEFDAICDEIVVVSSEPHLTRDQLHERD